MNKTLLKNANKRGKLSDSRLGLNPLSWIIFVVLLFATCYCAYKLLWAVFASIKPVDEFMDNILGLPEGHIWNWAWSNYSYIFTNFFINVTSTQGTIRVYYEELLANTLIMAIGGDFVTTMTPVWMAYLVTKFKYKFSSFLYMLVIVTMTVPLVGSNAALLKLLNDLRIYDTYIGFFLMKVSFNHMNFLIMCAAFKGVSDTYSEAAIIDGAGEFTLFFRINIPMVWPIILTYLLNGFIGYWNDYMTPLLFLPSRPTVSYGIYLLSNTNIQGFSRTPMRMATSIFASIPMIIVFIAFKNQIMRKMTLGGIKE